MYVSGELDEAETRTLEAVQRASALAGRYEWTIGDGQGGVDTVTEVDAWLIDGRRAERLSRILQEGREPAASSERIVGLLRVRRGPGRADRLLASIDEAWWTGDDGKLRRVRQRESTP